MLDSTAAAEAPTEFTVELPKSARRAVRLTVVTDSELQTFDSCPQLHHFKYRERLRPRVAAKPLAVGSIFHSGMRGGFAAGWGDLGRSLGTAPARIALQVNEATKSIDDRVGEWAASIVEHTADVNYEALAEEVDETARMVKFMLGHYFRQTRNDLAEGLVMLAAEMPFSVPMRDIMGRVVGHLRYDGVMDAVFYDPAYHAIVLYEHKTCGGDPRSIERRVEMDTQSAGYLHALREMQQDGTLAKASVAPSVSAEEIRTASVGRVVYNVLRKSYPSPPKVNKDGSVSVAACTTTPEMYLAALNEQVTARKIGVSEKQQKFLDDLRGKGDPFFARVEHHKTAAEIERWRSDAFVKARQIREADRDEQCRTRHTGHCNMPWSLPCSYRSICLDDTPELRAQFRVADDAHTEVKEARSETAEGAVA